MGRDMCWWWVVGGGADDSRTFGRLVVDHPEHARGTRTESVLRRRVGEPSR
jgi:hypothetical protein